IIMIQLQAVEKPAQLTDELVAELTQKYKDDGTDVWKQKYIVDALLKMSADKCCFCETKLQEESKYMEVEHFHPKSLYPDEVMSWENLLPICKRCNGKKSNHDTVKEPIIHPVRDNPKKHLRLKNYRFYGLTDRGQRIVSYQVLALNDSLRLVKKRFEIGEKIIEALIELLDMTNDYCNTPTNYKRNKIIGKLENIMTEGTREYEYSATAATVLLTNPDYAEIKQVFIAHNLWNDEFIELEEQVNYCALI
ncbi:MAG: HNH endonuclease domain-containing protein, partial [Methylococcales bacterium]|nr:HNH endonuclease domain-containing protein [Methylococcales bacterium]